jgi:hypothetical protein
MECRLQQQSGIEWQSRVYIRLETDRNGNPLREIEEKSFGGLIYKKDQLETMLRRAQLAILNPSVAMERFVTLDVDALDASTAPFGVNDGLAFSSNVVCVTVWGPEVPDLSFIDLPGESCIVLRIPSAILKRLARHNPERSRARKHGSSKEYGHETHRGQLPHLAYHSE